MRYFPVIMMVLTGTGAFAFDPFQKHALPSGKIFAVTVVHGCPTEELIEKVLKMGEELGADYTVVPEVVSASLCPAMAFGQMWAWHEVVDGPYGFSARMFGGIVVGLHYRITTE